MKFKFLISYVYFIFSISNLIYSGIEFDGGTGDVHVLYSVYMVRGNGGGGDPWVPVMSPPGGEGPTPSDPECQYSVSPPRGDPL